MISVIIPTYNRAEYISETISSVVNQDYNGEIEIIVIDDGSTDGTASLLKEIQLNVPFMKVIRTKNKGVSSARNTGLIESKGKFVQFLDSDDLIAPTKFFKQLKLLEENEAYGLCYCTSTFFKKDPSETIKIFKGSDLSHETILPAFMTSGQWQIHSPIYRRSACDKIGIWNEDLPCLEDWEYGCRAGLAGIKPIFCNETLAFAREHEGERLSYGDLERTAIALETASRSIAATMNREGYNASAWFNTMARHLVAAGRAFASVGNDLAAKRCLIEAKSIAKSKKMKLGILFYITVSDIFGYKRTLDLSRKFLSRQIGNGLK